MTWYPKSGDLTGYMHGRMEAAYQNRERPKCSRDDFFDGFIACLVMLNAKSMFRPGAWRDPDSERPSTR